MPTWKEEMERQARYARSLKRPGVYTMPLPEDKKQPKSRVLSGEDAAKPKKEKKKTKPHA